jgi:large subunit ribosomal protein L35
VGNVAARFGESARPRRSSLTARGTPRSGGSFCHAVPPERIAATKAPYGKLQEQPEGKPLAAKMLVNVAIASDGVELIYGHFRAPRPGSRLRSRLSRLHPLPPQRRLLNSNPKTATSTMPKMKSHSGARKRFKKTSNGKVKRRQTKRRHILTKKSPKKKRQLRKAPLVDETDRDRVKRMLG